MSITFTGRVAEITAIRVHEAEHIAACAAARRSPRVALRQTGVGGVLGTADVLEDLLLLDVPDDKIVIGPMALRVDAANPATQEACGVPSPTWPAAA
jgi:hypothetical protein